MKLNTCDIGKLNDNCCYPADHNDKTLQCKRRKRYNENVVQCSPSEGPCCDSETCSFKPNTHECAKTYDCTDSQNCNGRSPKCPQPGHRPDFGMFFRVLFPLFNNKKGKE